LRSRERTNPAARKINVPHAQRPPTRGWRFHWHGRRHRDLFRPVQLKSTLRVGRGGTTLPDYGVKTPGRGTGANSLTGRLGSLSRSSPSA